MALDILHDNWGPYTHTEVENALKAYLTVLENRINQAIQSGGVGLADLSAEVQALLNKANTALQPENIAAWAKAQNKPGYTVSEITYSDLLTLAEKLADMDQKIQAAAQSGGVDPDDEMSSTSENVVKNKVIKAYVDAAVLTLQNALNALMNGQNVTDAIDTFNEVVAFLNGIDTDDPTLFNQLKSLSDAITALQASLATKISGIKANGASETLPVEDGIVTLPPAGSTISPATAAPSMDGTAAVGTSTKYAREDHVHPHDTSKQDALTFDEVPTANSNNMVKSGGIKTALETLLSNIHIGANGNWYVGNTDTNIKAQGPKGNSVADGDTFDIVNNLTDGGEEDALSAEMGKKLKEITDKGYRSKYATPIDGGSPVIEEVELSASDLGVELAIGQRNALSNLGLGQLATANGNKRACFDTYWETNEFPSSSSPVDVFTIKVPAGWYSYVSFANTLANTSQDNNTLWVEGDNEITINKNFAYMGINFKKVVNGSDVTITDADIATLEEYLRVQMEQEHEQDIAPVDVDGTESIEIIDANGIVVRAMYNPNDAGKVALYTKDAVDALLGSVSGGVMKQNINIVQANIEKLYAKLANMAFWNAADKTAAAPTALDWQVPKVAVTIVNDIGASAVIKCGGNVVDGLIYVDQGDPLTLVVESASQSIDLINVTAAINGGEETVLPNNTLTIGKVNTSMTIVFDGEVDSFSVVPRNDVSDGGTIVTYGMQQGRSLTPKSISSVMGLSTVALCQTDSSKPAVILMPAAEPHETKIFTSNSGYSSPGNNSKFFIATGGKRYLNVKITGGNVTGTEELRLAVGCYTEDVVDGYSYSEANVASRFVCRVAYTPQSTQIWKIDLFAEATGDQAVAGHQAGDIKYIKLLLAKYIAPSSPNEVNTQTYIDSLTVKYKFTDD